MRQVSRTGLCLEDGTLAALSAEDGTEGASLGMGTSDDTAALLQAPGEGSQDHWTWRVGDRQARAMTAEKSNTCWSQVWRLRARPVAEGDSETGQTAVPSSTQGRLRRAPRTQNRSKMNTVGKLTVSNIETHQPAAVTRTVQTHTLLSDHRQNPERDPHKYPRLVCETLTAFTAVKYTQYLSF